MIGGDVRGDIGDWRILSLCPILGLVGLILLRNLQFILPSDEICSFAPGEAALGALFGSY